MGIDIMAESPVEAEVGKESPLPDEVLAPEAEAPPEAESPPPAPTTVGPVLLRDRYLIDFNIPLTDMDTPSAKGYTVEDRRDLGRKLFGLVCTPGLPTRTDAMAALKDEVLDGLMPLVEWDTIDCPLLGQRSMIVIYERPLGGRVLDAIKQFIASFPIAARTQSGIFMAHSLPSPFDWPYFDCGVFDRKLAIEDLIDTGAVYNMVWGRAHTAEQLENAAAKLQADIFVVGHQPQETGYAVAHDRMIILASDHNHGVFLPINLAKKHTLEELVKAIRPYVSVP